MNPFVFPLMILAGVAVLRAALKGAGAEKVSFSIAGKKVLLVGDSLAVGLSPPLKKLVEADGGQLSTRATVGTTIRQWARSPWLAASLASARPALVVASLGTNDLPLAGDRSEDVTSIVDQVRAAGAELVWVEPPTMTLPDRGNIRATLHRLVPASSLFPGPSVRFERAPDRIHATPKGYAELAAAVWDWMKRR
ncbi:MAG: SGNH/GDSL hydrolase family protein [Candidatus Fermentibacter sp.]|nr:SGNH/GDSL hydrolase family protein [Candidatus Fermentibacter sp.]